MKGTGSIPYVNGDTKQLTEAEKFLQSGFITLDLFAATPVEESKNEVPMKRRAGDTLASISRKFFKSSERWKDIQQANYSKLKGTSKLKPGMTLVIPK